MKTAKIIAALELFVLMLKPSLTTEEATANNVFAHEMNTTTVMQQSAATSEYDRTGTLWGPYIEWDVYNAAYAGNAFDLEATVTFVHLQSGEVRQTEMFYDGNGVWKFRFTGTRTGQWTFITSASDPDLDNLSGTVNILPNPDPNAKGFLKTQGSKFVRELSENGAVEAVIPKVYMNLALTEINGAPFLMSHMTKKAIRDEYIQEAKDNGFNAVFFSMNNQWFEWNAMSYNEHSSTGPDPNSFAVLETFIVEAHAAGLQTVIWAWGDEQRQWTPIGAGGINGKADYRLQRYIAARLGPIPGWSMGYGFDLDEWVTAEEIDAWEENIETHSGWDHLLWGRPYNNPTLQVVSNDERPTGNRTFDFYKTAQSEYSRSSGRPIIFERRFTYLRDGVWTMDNTRRSMWQFAMAGGAASWYGFYVESTNPYPNPEQIRTHEQFWQKHFSTSLKSDNTAPSGLAMKDDNNEHFIFYDENQSSITFDLRGMQGSGVAIAIDTKKPYSEIDLGFLSPDKQTWQAPYQSDWAIAVGQFENGSTSDWSTPITFQEVGNGHEIDLYIGGHSDGTDGLDIGFDRPLPPPPPGSDYYASLKAPQQGLYLSQDIRGWVDPFVTAIDWQVELQAKEGIVSKLSWDSAALPGQGTFILRGLDGDIDMRLQNSVEFTGSKSLTISYVTTTCFTFNFPVEGYAWYLISLPVKPADNSLSAVFPDAFAAFTWDSIAQKYIPASNLEVGKAYWVLFLQASTAEVCGARQVSFTNNYTSTGWDLIGSVTDEASVIDTPDGTITAWYKWDPILQELVLLDVLKSEPGVGYWAFISKAPSTVEVTSAKRDAGGNPIYKLAPVLDRQVAMSMAPPPPPVAMAEASNQADAFIPTTTSLKQNYPNPFNPVTMIEFHLAEKQEVTLKIFSILGQEIKTLVLGEKEAGVHRISWNAQDDSGRMVGSGVYLLKLQAGELTQHRRLILLK